MKQVNKWIALSFVFVLVFSFLAGCSTSNTTAVNSENEADTTTEEATTSEGEVENQVTSARTDINLSLSGTVSTLDPYGSVAGPDYTINHQIYETLLFIDEEYQLQPNLAESYEVNPDATEYTFHLRQGVLFSNGEELKASDVVFSYDRAAQSPYMASIIGFYDHSEVVDEYTVVIKLLAPDASFNVVAATGIQIMNEKFTVDAGESITDVTCGTGPYILESFVPDQSITLAANQDYWEGAPQIQTINFKVIIDPSSAAIALETGELDYLEVMPASWNTIESSGEFSISVLPTNSIGFAGLNTTKSPLDDVRVRQALNYAVNRDAIVTMALEGLGVPAYSMANPETVFGAVSPTEPYTYNPEKAKELLEEAGFAEGLDIGTIYTISGISFLETMAQVLQQSFAEVGVTSTVELGEMNAVISDVMTGNYDVVVISVDLFSDFQGFRSMYGTGAGYNLSGLSNPELDQLYDELAATTDSNERTPIIQQIVDIENQDAGYIPGYHPNYAFAWDKNLVIDKLFLLPYVKYMHWE